MTWRYVVLCALGGALLSGCGSSSNGSGSAGSAANATQAAAAAGATTAAQSTTGGATATSAAAAAPPAAPVPQTANGIAKYRDTPWALVGTKRAGSELVVFPLATRPACGKIKAISGLTATKVVVRVFIDYTKCKPSQSSDGVVVGPDETKLAKPIVVKLPVPVGGREVSGRTKVLAAQHVSGGAIGLVGLSPAQAAEVAKTLGSKVTIKGSATGSAVVRQSPKAGAGSTVTPPGGYRIWTS